MCARPPTGPSGGMRVAPMAFGSAHDTRSRTAAARRPGRARPRAFALVALLALAFCALDAVGHWPRLDPGPRQAFAQGDDRFPLAERRNRARRPAPPQQEQGFGFSFPFFFNWGRPTYRVLPDEPERPVRRPVHTDPARPPPPKKPETQPAKTVLVLGDSMADWLAYGLEEAFADGAEFGTIRKARAGSSLIRNEPRDFDWVQGAREILASDKADFVVMMIGLADRHAIKERPAARPPAQSQPQAIKPDAAAQPDIAASESEPAGAAVTHEFRSEKWVELYSKRVEEMIAALKGKRVPVIWVGLPPIRGPKSRADLSFLNDIFRAEAEKAGIVYVDVWEGFVDESGDYSSYGPDVIGQVRRLRSADGVYFTKAGARKLAHFVDREIRRLLNRETPVVLPVPEMPEKAPEGPSGPAPRPVAGPVVPLTGGRPTSEELLGSSAPSRREPDPAAVKVLVKGEPPPPAPGRADNFLWPPPQPVAENETAEPPPEAAAAAPARPADDAAARRAERQPASQAGKQPPRIGPSGPNRQDDAQASAARPVR